MQNYMVNITYTSPKTSGQQLVFTGAGGTVSVPTYVNGYFTATMLEARLTATGSYYTDALSNLLSLASGYTGNQPPLNS